MFNRRRFLAFLALATSRPLFTLDAQAASLPECRNLTKNGKAGAWKYIANPYHYWLNVEGGRRQFASSLDQSTRDLFADFQIKNDEIKQSYDGSTSSLPRKKQFRLEVDGRTVANYNVDEGSASMIKITSLIISGKTEQALIKGNNASFFLMENNNSWLYKFEFSLKGFARNLRAAKEAQRQLQKAMDAGKCTGPAKKSSSSGSSSGGSSADYDGAPPCFLTTATCGIVGLPDDCLELSTLRRFRDQYLLQQPGGQAQVDEYYRIAPAIVHNVNARSNARSIWLQVYFRWIIPSVVLVKLGLHRQAHSNYRKMVETLKSKYTQLTHT